MHLVTVLHHKNLAVQSNETGLGVSLGFRSSNRLLAGSS